MKRVCGVLLLCSLFLTMCIGAFAQNEKGAGKTKAESVVSANFEVEARSAVLMDATTGTVLFEQNATQEAPPASVTKVMTILLIMEAIDEGRLSLSETVSISAHAASMGGSQVFLEEGERMTVEDLLKCTVIASANDAAVALAERVCGSEAAFVARMNERASELGLTSTAFENVTGLDDTVTHHVTSAMDIAVMSRELLKHPKVLEYSSLWQDTIRGGAFTLTNTNRLVRYYDGCNGLKTGSTDAAGFCVSTTATRGNMTLIAVVMGAPTRDKRNEIARTLLDYGFSTYSLYECPEGDIDVTSVRGGVEDRVTLRCDAFCAVVPKGSEGKVECIFDLPDHLQAPVTKGAIVGKRIFRLNGEDIGECAVYTSADVQKISFFEIFLRYLSSGFAGR